MPVNMPNQLESNWCWAAVAVSVKAFYSPGSTMTQCQIATPVLTEEHRITAVECCSNSALCDIPAFLQDALNFGKNLREIRSGGSLAFKSAVGSPSVTSELNAGNPVGVRIQWPTGDGHFLLIDGYREFTVGPPVVHVADPQYQDTFIPYDRLARRYQDVGVWTDTFLLQK